MPFKQYPDNIATSVCISSEIYISDIDSGENTQLQDFGIQVFKYGLNTNVKMTVKAYTLADELIAESEFIDVDNIPTDTDYWYGWIYFKFNPRINLVDTEAVRFKFSLSGYTYSEASWVGLVYDWPITMGYNDNPDQIPDSPYAIDLLGKK